MILNEAACVHTLYLGWLKGSIHETWWMGRSFFKVKFYWLRFKVLGIHHLCGDPPQKVEPVISPRTMLYPSGRRMGLAFSRSGGEEEIPQRKNSPPFCTELRKDVQAWWTTTLVARSNRPACYGNPKGKIVSHISCGCLISIKLDLISAPQEGNRAWYLKPSH